MDPFVPEPEERLAHQETAAAKARPRNGDHPPPAENSLWPDGLREHAKLIIPLAVILALMLIQYGIQSSSINRLETELASLKTIKTRQANTEEDSDNSSLSDSSLADSTLAEVQQDLSEQADLIRTLEQRIATQIIDIDTLRGSVGGQGGGSSVMNSADRVEMEQIRKSLQTLETRLTALGGQAEKSLARISDQDKRVSDVQKTLQNQLAEAGKSQQAAQQKLRTELEQKLAAVDTRLDSGLTKALSEVDTRIAAVSGTIDKLQNEQQNTLTSQQKALTDIEKSVAGLNGKMSTGFTSTKAELDKALSQLDGRVAAVTSKISAVESTQKSALGDQQKLLTNLEKSVAGLNSKIDGVESAQKVALTSQAKSLQAQLASQLDSRLEPLSKQAAGVSSLEQKLTRQIAATDKALAETRQQLAALDKTVDLTAAANGDSGKTLAETRQALGGIEAKLASMTSEMDAALERLHNQEATTKEQQNVVNSNSTNPFADQIARQIDAKLAPQAKTLSSQASLIKSLEAKLAAQVADIKGLRGTSAKLGDDISATRKALEQARQNPAGQKSSVGAEQLDAFMTAVKLEVTGLNRELEGAVAKISQQESQLAQWSRDIDKRIAANPTGSKPAGGADISNLQSQLASQLKDMDKLRTANTQLATDVSSTRQQLDELRKTLDKPTADNATSAAGEADLLAIQAQVDDMTRKLESSSNRLSLQEKTFNEWQLELENRLAINERAIAAAKSSTPAVSADSSIDAELNHIKRTIVALKKQHPFVEFPGE